MIHNISRIRKNKTIAASLAKRWESNLNLLLMSMKNGTMRESKATAIIIN